MPAKKAQRGQKIDASKLFGASPEDNLDWAAGHNYDDEQAQEQEKKVKSPNADDRHVSITKAASFGNFRDEQTKTAGVPLDMQPPYVAFVKTFGRSVNEEVMRSYFSNLSVSNVLIINNDKALFAFIEFDTRDDLANALLVTGAKMMYQHPCTVDVAAPEQINKYQSTMSKRAPRHMHGRSPTSPKVDFDRDNIFGSSSAPEVDLDDLANEGDNNNNASGRGRGGRGGGGGGFRGMSKSGSANFDAGRDSIFGSAEPVPPPAEGDADGTSGGGKQQRGPGRFAGGKIGVSSASAQFGEISRDSVFGSATPSPNPNGRPQFGRNASKDSFESEGQNSDNSNNNNNSGPKEAPVFSRDMFGKAEVPPPPPVTEEGEEGADGTKKGGPRSPNSKGPRSGGRDGFFGTRESGSKSPSATEGSGNNNNNNNNNSNNKGGFARRSPTTQKENGASGDVGDRFGNFRNEKAQAPPPPPPAVKDSTGAGASKPSYAALAAAGGNWRS